MEITIDVFFEVMRGKARPCVIAAVLAEIEKDGSSLRGWLKGMEAWAKSRVPTVEKRDPSPMLPEGSESENLPTIRKSGATTGRRERVVVAPIVDDYLAYRAGTATTAAISRVVVALGDSGSELSRILKGVARTNCINGRNGFA